MSTLPRLPRRLVLGALGLGALLPALAWAAATRGGPLGVPLPLFPSGNWWNQDIRQAPVDARSASLISFIGNTRTLHPDFGGYEDPGPPTSTTIYGFPYVVVNGNTQPKRVVSFDYSDESDGVNHDTGESFPFYPIPDEAKTQAYWIEGGPAGNQNPGGDRHMLIVDVDNNDLYELYSLFWDGSRWTAGSGAFFDMDTNDRRPDGWTSADAAGLAILPGLVRYDEVYGPDPIRHALRMTVRTTNGYVYPASHAAGSTAGALPMGARLRLKPNVDVTALTSDTHVQKIFQAMQTYGLIVADNGSDMYISGAFDPRWDNGILNPAFGALTASQFEVITLGWEPSGPALSVADVAPFEEGHVGVPDLAFTVTLDPPAAADATVEYSTVDGTASAGSDYTATSGTLTFPIGVTTLTVHVPVLSDLTIEPNETFRLHLSAPVGAQLADADGLATILNDDPPRAVSLAANTVTVVEATAAASVTIRRTGLLTGVVTVGYETSDGSARAGRDYLARRGTLTFGPGVATRVFSVPLINDTLAEGSETFVVRLSNAAGALLGPLDSGLVTIRDNDVAGAVQLSAANLSVAEGRPAALINVTRSGGAASGVGVAYATGAGTATAGLDYAAAVGTLTFRSGQTSASFAVPILNDSEAEGAETISVTLSNPTGGATLGPRAAGTLTLLDDEGTLELGATAFTAVEGAAALLPVRRTGSLAGVATVHYQTTDGTAVAGVDYTGQTGTLTFAGGVAARSIAVPTRPNTVNNGPRAFTLALDSPTGGPQLGHRIAAPVTIADNDPGGVVQFAAPVYSVLETGRQATLAVSRRGGAAAGVTVDYATADGTATAGEDYTTRTGTLTFNAGQASASFTVPIADDTSAEGGETVALFLSSVMGGATPGTQMSATLSITDDDGPTLQIARATQTVGEAGRVATVTVTRRGGTSGTAAVTYTTADGTARAGEDYTAVTSSLTFLPGQSTRTFTIPILDDTLDEPNETFTVSLSSPSGAGLGAPATLTLTITDNDVAGTLQLAAAAQSVAEPEAGTTRDVTVTVTRTGGAASSVSVDFVTTDGTAVAPGDYAATSGTLSFGAGQTSATFVVTVNGDTEAEGNEALEALLSNPAGGAVLGVQNRAPLWITEPAEAVKLVFIHHSTGGNWLADNQGQLALALRDNNYFVSDTNYGWGPAYAGGSGTIGDHTDIGHWWEWFVGPSSPTYLAALFQEYGETVGYTRLADPDPSRENEIVLFKSCFPSSNLGGSPTDPPTTGPNPLRGQDASSELMTVGNAKGIYNDLLATFAAHPEKLFVVVTAPPLAGGDTSPEAAANARALNDWLVHAWLVGYALPNVAVLDFYNVLTSNAGSPAANDLGREGGNHHRFWSGALQHVHPLASNVSAYPSAVHDSHPTAAGGRKASGELVPLLNFYYNRWQGVAAPTLGRSSAARVPAAALAPPARGR